MRLRSALLAVAAAGLLCRASFSEEPAEAEIRKAAEHWSKMEVAEAVTAWKKALELDPANAAARSALSRLEPVFERTDEFLGVMEELVDKGSISAASDALSRWWAPFASRDQQARVLILKGRISLAKGRADAAVTNFAAAETAAASPDLKLSARLGKARGLLRKGDTRAAGAAMLEGLSRDVAGKPIAGEVAWELVRARALAGSEKAAALRKFLADYPASEHAAEARMVLSELAEAGSGRPTADSLSELVGAFRSAGELAGRSAACGRLKSKIAAIDDDETLMKLAAELEGLAASWDVASPPPELAALVYRRLAATNRGPAALAAVRSYQKAAKGLVDEGPADARRPEWRRMHAESLLMEGQLLLLAGRELEATRELSRAADAYRAILADGERGVAKTLLRIGLMLESRGRPDAAAQHYALVARSATGEDLGARALYSLASVYRRRLDRPLEAIEALKRYVDLYPPSFRAPTTAQDRIRKLGYADVASFQAAHGLKVDGVVGSGTLSALRSEEMNFREVLPERHARSAVHGTLVHETIFAIAEDLRERGRFREAVEAYGEFLSMYPGHRLGDDALLAIARLFKENDLFEEASSAYDRLMADYPKGDKTSHAYLEAAYCRECLGQWREAEELYDLFLKKFPYYRRSAEARRKLAALKKLIRYADLVDEAGLADAKMADALYEMGRILYKEMKNLPKAAETFAAVADRHKKTYHGPDARFSGGVCHLHEQNFDAARAEFARLVADHPESRLADDALYWIGHTHEYQARALGKLDEWRIVVRKRSAAESARLRSDLALRLRFNPAAAPAAPWHQPHPDIIRAGKTREKVRGGLRSAITAYRKVVADHRLGDMAQKALLRVGAIYSDYLGDPDRAIEAYRELLEKYPGSAEAVDAQFAVGRHYLEREEYARAEKAITLFLSSFPNHSKAADALLDLAECHRRQKEWVKALDDYQSFLSRFGRDRRAKRVREEIEWLKKYRF